VHIIKGTRNNSLPSRIREYFSEESGFKNRASSHSFLILASSFSFSSSRSRLLIGRRRFLCEYFLLLVVQIFFFMLGKCLRAAPHFLLRETYRKRERDSIASIRRSRLALLSTARASEEEVEDVVVVVARSRRQKEKRCRINTQNESKLKVAAT